MGTSDNDDSDGMNDPILVVDDDSTLRRALSRILRSEGHEVLEAANGAQALDLVRTHDPSLIVLDFAMPGMDGGRVLENLRDEHPGNVPPTVLLTASGDEQGRALEIGAEEGLGKPFRVDELLVAVAKHRRKVRGDAS